MGHERYKIKMHFLLRNELLERSNLSMDVSRQGMSPIIFKISII